MAEHEAPATGTSAITSVKADLDDAPYTKNLLLHAHPEHLHLTSSRLFIGPIPKGWLNTHKKTWYGIKKEYVKRATAFEAQPGTKAQRQTAALANGHEAAARETVSQTSEQVSSETYSTVPTSLQSPSHSGASQPVVKRNESNLDEVLRASPAVRFLAPSEPRGGEEELHELETDDPERDEEDRDIMDLEPVPTNHGQQKIADNLNRTPSQEPLVR